MKIVPVILSGGSGWRLWPLSRETTPKQFHALVTSDTLFQDTLQRVSHHEHYDPVMVICNQDHRFAVAEQAREKGIILSDILLEPVARNTAAAIAIACLHASPETILLILPADHAITDLSAFQQAVDQAAIAAQQGLIVTFGIVPAHPETGYGYIKAGTRLEGLGKTCRIERFVEKPDAATAESLLAEGGFTWNAGMFCARADSLRLAFELYAPEILTHAAAALENGHKDLDFYRLSEKYFSQSPSMAFDTAIMEKIENGAVIPVNMGWSDVGAWSSLWDLAASDESANVTHGDVALQNCAGSLVRSDGILTACVGLKDMIVIAAEDAVLVAPKNQSQEMKKLVETLKIHRRPEMIAHRKAFRPWGSAHQIGSGDGYELKKLVLRPGGAMRIQRHLHRTEHWVVLSGTALIRRDDETTILHAGESLFAKPGVAHSIQNPTAIELHLIEVRTGAVIDEEDIQRLA